MHILVGISEKGSQGGPAACEPPFIAELRRLGHSVAEEVYAYATAQASLSHRTRRVFRTARRFQERVHDGKFDLVHLNTSFDKKALLRDAIIVPRLKSTRAKIFLKFHGSDARLLETRNPAFTIARRRVLGAADGIGVLSAEEQANFLRAGVPEAKLFVIKNAVEQNIQPPDPEFLQRWNLPTDRPLLLFIGRFIEAKGLLDVIAAAQRLRASGLQFQLLCLGDGPIRVAAEALVEHLNLQESARFFGYIPEEQAAGFYANSTMLVFPTYHYEGFPMVIFNAAAAGLPLITTRIRAAADYLKEPDNCLWVKPKNPELLARRISTLLADGELRGAMSKHNKQLAMQFAAANVTSEYLAAYERVRGTER